jgi:carboxylesterase type B
MFWIHGGGLGQGSGLTSDKTILSTEGVVVVTINYRLGPYVGDASPLGNVYYD